MDEQCFLALVRKKGRYATQGEANRAVNSVFGTTKAWLPPATSDVMRKALPGDASRLWRYCPVEVKAIRHDDGDASGVQPLQFVLRVQQLGGYESSREARRAITSVIGALALCFPRGSGRFIRRMFPSQIMEAFGSYTGWAA